MLNRIFSKQLFLKKEYSKQFIEILFFGIISALPFVCLSSNIKLMLLDNNYTLEIATTILIAKSSYSLKFIWAPFLDYLRIPILHRMGKRKSWMFLTSVMISLCLIVISFVNTENFYLIYILSFFLGFFGSCFDISLDAFRIETIGELKQGYAASFYVIGYRIGIIIAGAGGLHISDEYSWGLTFLLTGFLVICSSLYIPFLQEKEKFRCNVEDAKKQKNSDVIVLPNYRSTLEKTVIMPFKDFFQREWSFLIIIGIISYKLCDVLLGTISVPFYFELGYTKKQVVYIIKIFGFFATIFGSLIGAEIVRRKGNIKAMFICGALQGLVNAVYIWLHYAVVQNFSLFITITLENLAGGMGTVALISYLSSICNKKHTATQFALLSGAASLINNTIAAKSGAIVNILGWDLFFIFTILSAIPAVTIFIYIDTKVPIVQNRKR